MRPMRLMTPLLAVLVLMAPGSAMACRAIVPPAQRIGGDFDAIAVGVVLQAAYTEPRGHDWHPWQGTARLTQSVEGRPATGDVQFGRTGSSAACDDGIAPPSRGERWVFYFERMNGVQRLRHAYPLDLIRPFDRRLRNVR